MGNRPSGVVVIYQKKNFRQDYRINKIFYVLNMVKKTLKNRICVLINKRT